MTTRNGLRAIVGALSTLLVAVIVVPSSVAQEQPPALERPAESELREELLRYFESLLRADLALSDEEMDRLMPRVRELEQQRREFQREKIRATRDLRRGYRSGVGDEELGRLLGQVEEIEQRSQLRTREMMQEIDRQLTVRQQVQFRGTVQRFRQDVQRRIRELRGGSRQAGPPGQRPTSPPRDRLK